MDGTNGIHTVSVPKGHPQTSKDNEGRGHWRNKAEFFLTVMGAIIGPGNVWRFPYLCYRNGGGMGYASHLIILFSATSYIIIIAWAFFYLFSSFSADLPWATCGHEWNTGTLSSNFWRGLRKPVDVHFYNYQILKSCLDPSHPNVSLSMKSRLNTTLPVMEFWQHRVLKISSGIEDVGSLRWELVFCLILTWVLCYFCVWKGIKSTGKAAFFTATFPFIMLFVLLIRGVTLPGAIDGIIYYLYPDISRLSDPQVWMDAGTQIFFSYAIGLGFLTSLGSYNTFNNDCYKDCFYLCLLNSATSIVSGFAIFSVLGPGLAFIVYPRAVAMMPMPQVWSVCFFLMIILLGLDSQFVGLECLMTSLTDLFPALRRGYRRELVLLAICSTCCIMGLSLVTEGGMYLLQLLDHHVCSGTTLLLLSFCQSVSIAWVYGADRFYGNIKDMIGYRPFPLMKYCWRYITPLFCFGTFIFSIVKYTPLRFNNTYVYPFWANILGWFIASVSLSLIPLFMLYEMMHEKGPLRQRFLNLCKPMDLTLDQKSLPMLGTTTSVELKPLSPNGGLTKSALTEVFHE
ncbi:hypothetical protein F7725_006969 [Dissostichus mawsoni]|uniref:Uncharacterized protein n=1 Tax=Dissostichus mawsoni TaxID=36200 RepID=A0A7J5XX14_DISMA|nr:hypothetical protein F7725_006969 [Dissostichus mawsoni]